MTNVFVIDASKHFPAQAEDDGGAITIKSIVSSVTTRGRNQHISDDVRLALGTKYDRSSGYSARYNSVVNVGCMRFAIHVHNAQIPRWSGLSGSNRNTSVISIPVIINCKKLSDYSIETWTAGFQSLFAEIAQFLRSNAWVGLAVIGSTTQLIGASTLMRVREHIRKNYNASNMNMFTGIEATNAHSVNADEGAVAVQFRFDYLSRGREPRLCISWVCHPEMPIIWTLEGMRSLDRGSRQKYRQMRKRFVSAEKTGGAAYLTNVKSYHDFIRLVYDNINGPWTYSKRSYGVIDAEDATLLKVAGIVEIR